MGISVEYADFLAKLHHFAQPVFIPVFNQGKIETEDFVIDLPYDG